MTARKLLPCGLTYGSEIRINDLVDRRVGRCSCADRPFSAVDQAVLAAPAPQRIEHGAVKPTSTGASPFVFCVPSASDYVFGRREPYGRRRLRTASAPAAQPREINNSVAGQSHIPTKYADLSAGSAGTPCPRAMNCRFPTTPATASSLSASELPPCCTTWYNTNAT